MKSSALSFYGNDAFQAFMSTAVPRFQAAYNISVNIEQIPLSTNDFLQLLLNALLTSSSSTNLDLFPMDCIYPGVFSNRTHDVLDPSLNISSIADLFIPELLNNAIVDDELVSVPVRLDFGLLYYRTDLLKKYNFAEPPSTYDELEMMAHVIGEGERVKNTSFVGYIWQGAAYEGLTCNIMEWLGGHNGGRFLDAKGHITINNPNAKRALERAKSWIYNISSIDLLVSRETDVEDIFKEGNAAFMRGWPTSLALFQNPSESKIVGKVGITRNPGETKYSGKGTFGGWNIAISKFSKLPKEAAEFIKFISTPEEQIHMYHTLSYLPTIQSLYSTEAHELCTSSNLSILCSINTTSYVVPRPSTIAGSLYPALSSLIYNSIHNYLLSTSSIDNVLNSLECEIMELMGDKVVQIPHCITPTQTTTQKFYKRYLTIIIACVVPGGIVIIIIIVLMLRRQRLLRQQIVNLQSELISERNVFNRLSDEQMALVNSIMKKLNEDRNIPKGLLDIKIEVSRIKFTNEIGTGSFGTVYAGTLSIGKPEHNNNHNNTTTNNPNNPNPPSGSASINHSNPQQNPNSTSASNSQHHLSSSRHHTNNSNNSTSETLIPVAVKILKRIDEDNVKRFRAEIIMLRQLRHPNIILLVGCCWGEDLMALIMELMPNGSLHQALRNRSLRMTWDDPLFRITKEVVAGMEYLHSQR